MYKFQWSKIRKFQFSYCSWLFTSGLFSFSKGSPLLAIEPVPESCVSTAEERTLAERERWWKRGLKAISEGKLAVVLLSGGQVCKHSLVLLIDCILLSPSGIIYILYYFDTSFYIPFIFSKYIISVSDFVFMEENL